MIALIQRVSSASVQVDSKIIGQINHGMLVLLGVEATDSAETAERLVNKLLKFRMFNDDAGKMNQNIEQVGGDILVVSQFTLVADTKKGNRPGFSRGAPPSLGLELYNHFNAILSQTTECKIATGQFGADMQVALVNDGPVTFQITMD